MTSHSRISVPPEQQTFWDHLDQLRIVIIRILVVTLLMAVVAFCFKEQVFTIVLAPKANVHLINTQLTQQFVIHMKMSFYAGLLVSSPYILYQIFRFITPALYFNERKYFLRLCGGGYLMFLVGALFSYFCVFPFVIRFLGNYQVDPNVVNTITIESYISTFISMTLVMGLIFQLPVLCWLFAKFGFLSSSFMTTYRRHAIVAILVVAAIITPTTDVFTLLIVSIPMYLLYEISILLVRRANKN